jgi:predicted permease
MLTVLEVTLPVFGLVFCGFAGAYLRLLPERAVEGINAFVFWFALPAMLFRVVALRPLAQLIEPRFFLAYVSAGLFVFFGTALVSRMGAIDPAQRTAAQSTAWALTATHGNIGYLGLALVGELGRELLPFAALTVICDIFVVITLGIGLLEVQTSAGRPQGWRIVRTVAAGLLRSPLVMSIAIGLLFSLAGAEQPAAADNFTRMLANAAGPCALFAIGAALGGQRIGADRSVLVLGAIKLLVHPLVAAVYLLWVFNVPQPMASVGILCAALPSASNTFIIAQRYQLDTRAISAAILGGTFLSVATVTTIVWALGLRG